MLKAYVETFQKYRYLLLNLITRDLKVKYRRSVLGILWSLLNPIFMMLIMNAVFSRIFNNSIPNFPLYLISGQLIFSCFNEGTSSALSSIVGASALMKKVYIPKYLFPLEKVAFAFVNLGFSLVAVVIMIFLFKVPFSPRMLLFPLPIISMFGFVLGFGMLLSALCVFFRDIKHLYTVLLLAWTYLTPIFYPVSLLGDGLVYKIVMLNPMTWYVQYFRYTVNLDIPHPSLTAMNLVCFGWAIGFMLLGLVCFRRLQDRFILHI